MHQEELIRKLYDPCKERFSFFVKKYGIDQLIGFGLYTDEDYMNIGIIGATKIGLERNKFCNEEEFLFSTDEWDQMSSDDGCEEVNELTFRSNKEGEQNEEENPDWYTEYRRIFESSCLSVLERLLLEGSLGSEQERDKIFYILGVSDSLLPYTDGVEWSKRLNKPKIHARYSKYAEEVRKSHDIS